MRVATIADNLPAVIDHDGVAVVAEVLPELRDLPVAYRMPRFIELAHRNTEVLNRLKLARRVPMADVRLMAPVPRPPKLLCALGNYREGLEYSNPLDMFLKSPESVIGPEGVIRLPDRQLAVVHHEAELALVIGQSLSGSVSPEQARSAIFGYTAFIDVSARGVGAASFIGKSFDGFGPMGPWIVTADELGDPQNVRVRLWVNGEPRHDFRTSDMDHPVEALVVWAASVTTLRPGDVIATGTNHQGIGRLQDGDLVEIDIEQIGKMRVRVDDPQHRSWPRGIDTQTAAVAKEWRAGNRSNAKL